MPTHDIIDNRSKIETRNSKITRSKKGSDK